MKEKNTASAEILFGLPFQKAYERLLKTSGHREQEKPFGSKSKASKRANACYASPKHSSIRRTACTAKCVLSGSRSASDRLHH